jgi:two-component system nitrogen regulation response regulator GlnG
MWLPRRLLGETGVGKELMARAIHQASPRRDGPYLPVNMAALPSQLAASELLGHEHGAFTGAASRRTGHLVRARGGMLLLDAFGDTSVDVQTMLLRTLETAEVWPLGADRPVKVDVRLIAATDRDLSAADSKRPFRQSLLHRLSGYVIQIAPLRHRMDDVPRLFVHRLQRDMLQVQGTDPMASPVY